MATLAALAVLGPTCAASAVPPILMAGSAVATTSVRYHGLRLQVPASWSVVDLGVDPGACVRFDVHAVYLGHPGAEARCPAGLRGLADALLIEPLDEVSARTFPVVSLRVPGGADLPTTLPATTGHVTTMALEGPGVLVTATYAPYPGAVSRILAGASIDASAHSASSGTGTPPAESSPASGPEAMTASAGGATSGVEVPGTFTGLGFDACEAPSPTTMDAWLASPYRAVAVYVGGAARACAAQANLTADWVARQVAQGWHLLPLYVGLQAPATCADAFFGGNVIDPAQAAAQGGAAADDAANAASALGIGQGSVITYDLETYTRQPACSTPVLQFLSAWTTQLHARGYRSSVYSSASSAIADLVDTYNVGAYTRPDQIFLARWDGAATTWDAVVPSEFWSDHQRVKQYQGAHDESYGGVRINLDNDYLDVAANSTIMPDTTPPTTAFVAPASGALLHGISSVIASAADPSGISRVELLVNGQLIDSHSSAPWVFRWASGGTNGQVILGLRAYDLRGNVQLAQTRVSVDNTLPTVRITKGPADHARVSGTTAVLVTATDTSGIAGVELWINGKRTTSDSTRPYQFRINTSRYPRRMTVQVRAVDRAGNATTLTRTWRR